MSEAIVMRFRAIRTGDSLPVPGDRDNCLVMAPAGTMPITPAGWLARTMPRLRRGGPADRASGIIEIGFRVGRDQERHWTDQESGDGGAM